MEDAGVYSKASIQQQKYKLLKQTCLTDKTTDILKAIDNNSFNVAKNTEKWDEKMKALEEGCKVLLDIVRNETESDELINAGNFNENYLNVKYGIDSEQIESFFQYARVLYQKGLYLDSNLILFYYRAICPEQDKLISCYWGKTASRKFCVLF